MAVHNFGTNDNKTVKTWSKALEREVLPATLVGRFMGKGPDSAVQVKDELTKSAGDRIRITQSELLDSDGVSGNETLEGNESTQAYNTQDINIDQQRNAVRWYGRIDQQRVAFDIREDAKVRLRDWFADTIDRAFINQLTGNTVETDTKKTGLNAVTAPSSNHIIYGGNATSVATLNAGDEFSLDLLDKAKEKMEMLSERSQGYTFRPLKGGYYGAILSPAQIYDLRTNTNTGQWLDIQKAAMQGGSIGDNPIFTGAHGVYNNFVIFENSRIPKGNNSGAYFDNSRAAVVFGAQAAFAAFGRDGGRPERFLWNEESFDYGNEHGCSAALIWGLEKAIFNSIDHAAIVIATYTTTN